MANWWGPDMNAPFTLKAQDASIQPAWASPALKALYDAVQDERDRIRGWHDGDDDTAEQAHALDALMEAAEELDIRIGNAGWLPTFKGSLDGGSAF